MTMFHTWTIAAAERLCDWIERAGHLETLTDAALADLVEDHLWADQPLCTPASDLLMEVIFRLRKKGADGQGELLGIPLPAGALDPVGVAMTDAEIDAWLDGLPDEPRAQAQSDATMAYVQERLRRESAPEGGADGQRDT